MKYDVLLVLGYNADPGDPVFRARVDRAVALFQQGEAPRILMSGCCSVKLDRQPERTEAACMRDYAVTRGVPPSAIFVEEESVDTLGNFYFSKVRWLLPYRWFSVGLVSTPWHIWRSEWLALKVLGPEFTVNGLASRHPDGWGDDRVRKSEQYNRRLLEETRVDLAHVIDGDHEAVRGFLGEMPGS